VGGRLRYPEAGWQRPPGAAGHQDVDDGGEQRLIRGVLRSAALRPHLRRWDQRLRDLPQAVRNNPIPRTPPHVEFNDASPRRTRSKELEPKTRCLPHSQLLAELADSCLLIGLADSRSTADPEFVVPRETGQVLGPPMDEKTALPIAAHHHANPVQPALPIRIPPTDYPQHTILSINTFHEFIHDAHDRRSH
jgi:hypothetical protein